MLEPGEEFEIGLGETEGAGGSDDGVDNGAPVTVFDV